MDPFALYEIPKKSNAEIFAYCTIRNFATFVALFFFRWATKANKLTHSVLWWHPSHAHISQRPGRNSRRNISAAERRCRRWNLFDDFKAIERFCVLPLFCSRLYVQLSSVRYLWMLYMVDTWKIWFKYTKNRPFLLPSLDAMRMLLFAYFVKMCPLRGTWFHLWNGVAVPVTEVCTATHSTG